MIIKISGAGDNYSRSIYRFSHASFGLRSEFDSTPIVRIFLTSRTLQCRFFACSSPVRTRSALDFLTGSSAILAASSPLRHSLDSSGLCRITRLFYYIRKIQVFSCLDTRSHLNKVDSIGEVPLLRNCCSPTPLYRFWSVRNSRSAIPFRVFTCFRIFCRP